MNLALIAHVEFHSIVRLTEHLDLPGVEEVPQGFVSFLEVLIILLCIFQCRVEGFRRGGVDQRGHQGNARIHGVLAGEIRLLPVSSLLPAQLIPQSGTLLLQIAHQLLVIIRGNALFKQVAHHITDKALLLIGGVLADVAQQTLLRLHSGKQTLELLRIPAGKAELLMVHGQRQDAIRKQACNQPLHIHRQETIRLLGKDAQQRFQRGRHRSRQRIALNTGTDIVQGAAVAGTVTAKPHLPGICKQFADILLRNRFVNVRQVVEQAFHLLLQGIIQACLKVAGAAGQLGAVHINIRFRQCLLQKHLNILTAFLHFLLLCFANRPIFGDTTCGAAAQIVLNLQHGTQLGVQAGIVMQLHKNGVVAAFAGGQHLQAGKGIIAIDFPIEAEGITAIQIRITVLVRAVVFIKDQRCQFAVHFGIFRPTARNFSVDLLLLIGQEDVIIA